MKSMNIPLHDEKEATGAVSPQQKVVLI